jgi:GT2 family glycosyltransferase
MYQHNNYKMSSYKPDGISDQNHIVLGSISPLTNRTEPEVDVSMANVVVIVVNWNLKYETARCLQSLMRSEYPHRVIVIDNGSRDGSVEYLQSHFPHITLLPLLENLGFGSGCNQAIQVLLQDSSWDYILLINNDATIHPAALTHLVQAAEANHQAGILGPKIYYNNPPNRIWYAGARQRKNVLAASDTGRGQTDLGQFDDRQQVDFVFGAGMFIRRQVLEQVGLFDEQFFIYLEDLDLCLRTQKAGFSLLFVPDAHVWHRGSASTERLPNWRKYHHARSTILFLRKHARQVNVASMLIFWMLVCFRSIILEASHGNPGILRTYWSGIYDGMSHNPAAFEEWITLYASSSR